MSCQEINENAYHDAVDVLVDGFRYELCAECGRDLQWHVISPDPLGNPHAWCAGPPKTHEGTE